MIFDHFSEAGIKRWIPNLNLKINPTLQNSCPITEITRKEKVFLDYKL
jgi:hypothetical protein